MLGCAHNRQPTSECLDMCTAVNHDPARVSVKSAISVTYVISCGFIVFGINKFWRRSWRGGHCGEGARFGINKFWRRSWRGGHGVGVRWEAVLEKVTRSQVGVVSSGEGRTYSSPRWDRSRWGAVPGGGQHFAFFCRLPTLISYVSNLVWVFRGVVLVFWASSFAKTLKRSGCHTMSREPRCVFFCQ